LSLYWIRMLSVNNILLFLIGCCCRCLRLCWSSDRTGHNGFGTWWTVEISQR